MIPVVGAAINGGFDFSETKIIANRAYKWFVNGDISEEKIDESGDDSCMMDADKDDVQNEVKPDEPSDE